ncbi:hypothetical protein [Exiguobacterium indicum]|uniref:hypothetical protein n=1 Tax=Exiguobacterium indicum TaxID=296995 RepID=UPI002B259ABA|nr:hypothetical protein [Exiguobacterium indicum]
MRPMSSDPKKQAFTKSMYAGHLWDYESFLAGYEAAEERFLEQQEGEPVSQTLPATGERGMAE